MEDRELILTKAIAKAVEHGWKPEYFDMGKEYEFNLSEGVQIMDDYTADVAIPVTTTKGKKIFGFESYDLYMHFSIRDLLFNHNFAKALFGEVIMYDCTAEEGIVYAPAYLVMLKRMVVSKDPIKEIEEFLNDPISNIERCERAHKNKRHGRENKH